MKIKLRDLTEEQYEKWLENNCTTITLCGDCPFFKVMCCVKTRCWVENKELYSDKFLDQEIEIEDEPLTDKERQYLSSVIKPFRNNVETIEKIGSEYLDSDNDFIVVHLVEDSISLPILNTSFKFKGMELNKQYTLKELRL